MKCSNCGEARFTEVTHTAALTVGGRTYRTKFPADKCTHCGDVTFDSLHQHAFELGVALFISRNAARSGEEFAFMRKAIGLPATGLADLLDVTRETISRWERGHQPLERRAVVILGDLVGDHLEGNTRTLDRLRALKEPPKLAKTVPIELDAKLRRAAAR